MTEQSIAAYDVSQRVKTYDADMELMHPNRSKMVQVAIEVLPFPKTAALRAIDLGIGTGYFTEQFLNHFPNFYSISKPILNPLHISKSSCACFNCPGLSNIFCILHNEPLSKVL